MARDKRRGPRLPSGIVRSELSKELKYARIRFGKTQDEVAIILGITRSKISRWESGENEPSIHDFIYLCQLYKTTPNRILGFKDV